MNQRRHLPKRGLEAFFVFSAQNCHRHQHSNPVSFSNYESEKTSSKEGARGLFVFSAQNCHRQRCAVNIPTHPLSPIMNQGSRWKIRRNVPKGERDCGDSYLLKGQSYHDYISGTKYKNWLFFEPCKLVFLTASLYKYVLGWGWEICRMSSVM